MQKGKQNLSSAAPLILVKYNVMTPHKDSLEELAKAYILYLIKRDENVIKKHLSLNFMLRQKVTQQIKLITQLPELLHGVDFEVFLLEEYDTSIFGNTSIIAPFQFDVCYTPYTSLIDMEKITITINGVFLEDNEWKIESIISDDERHVLMNVIENLKDCASV